MDTRTKITVAALLTAFSASTATAVPSTTVLQTSGPQIVVTHNTNAFLSQDEIKVERRKKSYRDRYKKLGQSQWFNKHYNNKSLGEVSEIVD